LRDRAELLVMFFLREREREREECLSVCVVVYKCEAKFMKSTLSRYGVGVMLYFGPRMMGFVLF
jgi:hypothetical protein